MDRIRPTRGPTSSPGMGRGPTTSESTGRLDRHEFHPRSRWGLERSWNRDRELADLTADLLGNVRSKVLGPT